MPSEVIQIRTTGGPTVRSLADAWIALVTSSLTSNSAVSASAARPHSRVTDRTCPRATLGAVGMAASSNRVCNGHGAGGVTVIVVPISQQLAFGTLVAAVVLLRDCD